MKLPWTKPQKRTFTESQVEEMTANMLEVIQSSADLDLLRDEQGWDRLGEGEEPLRERDRLALVRRSRVFAVREPLCKQSLNLYTNFGLGTGIQWASRDDKTKKILTTFWNDPENRPIVRSSGQRKSSNRYQTDGEYYAILFFRENGKVVLRPIDSLQITEIAYAIEDNELATLYVREFTDRAGKKKTRIYRDITNVNKEDGVTLGGKTFLVNEAENSAVMIHITLDSGRRGTPRLSATVDFCQALRKFMQSRVAVQRAIATHPQKLKLGGGQDVMTKQKNKWQSGFVGGGSNETNPVSASGALWLENAGAELKNMNMETGAAAAKIDGAMLMQMTGAGVGIFPHYFGAGESFRLATATAMETPMLKAFEAYGADWVDFWTDVFNFVLTVNGVKDSNFDIRTPPVFPLNKEKSLEAITNLVSTVPGFIQIPELQKLILTLLGFSGVDDILSNVEFKVPEGGAGGMQERLIRDVQEVIAGANGHG